MSERGDLTFTMPARPTGEEEGKWWVDYYERMKKYHYLSLSSFGLSDRECGPTADWLKQSTAILLAAIEHMSVGEARSVLAKLGEELDRAVALTPITSTPAVKKGAA